MNELQELVSELTAIRNPATGKPISFNLKKGQHLYNFYRGPRGEMFCYTPHADKDGNYWCFTYRPFGKGSRSGTARQWKLMSLVRCARRKIADKKAHQRL